MWARVATFQGGDPERMQDEIERRLREPGGFPDEMKGLLVLADREENRRVFVALLESRAALEQAEPGFNRMRDEIPEEVRGQRTSLEYYEVVAQHMT